MVVGGVRISAACWRCESKYISMGMTSAMKMRMMEKMVGVWYLILSSVSMTATVIWDKWGANDVLVMMTSPSAWEERMILLRVGMVLWCC